ESGIFVSSTAAGSTVQLAAQTSPGHPQDTLTGIDTIIGTSGDDFFSGIPGSSGMSNHVVYQGNGGFDAYVFNAATDRGLVEISDTNATTSGASGINVDNVVTGATALSWQNVGTNDVDLTFRDVSGGGSSDLFTIRLDKTALLDGTEGQIGS